jgi:hypothetical protein
MGILSALVAAVAGQEALAASSTVSFSFDRTADLGNPLIGFAHYYSFGQMSPSVPCRLENFYLPMRSLMQGWNDFIFDQGLESKLAEIASRNRTAIFRIYLTYPGKTKKPTDAVPDFLINGGLAFNSFSGGVSPDWEDSNLIKAMTQLIEAMGKRYDADPRIANINIGFLGHWGEWHGGGQVQFASTETQKQVLDAYQRSFKVTQMSARYPDVFGGLKAGDTRFGYHDDSFVQDTTISQNWGFMNRMKKAGATEQWKVGAIGGEFRPELQKCYFDNDDWKKVCGGAPKVAVFTISGAAGTWAPGNSTATTLNGDYFEKGSKNNRPTYMKQGGWEVSDAIIRWEVAGDWGADNLGTPGKSKWTAAVNDNHRYFSEIDAATPPQDGWTARTDFATGTISIQYKGYEGKDCGNCPDGSFEDDVAVTHSSWQWNNQLNNYNDAEAARARNAVASMGYKFYLKQVTLSRQGSTVKIEAKVENRGVAPFYYPVLLQVEVGAAAATLGSLDALLPGEMADLSAQLDASGDTAFLSLRSPWAPTGVRFAIAEQQSEQHGVVGVTVELPAASSHHLELTV